MDGVTVMRRADELGAVSDEPGMLVRTFGSDAMRRANELVGSWMRSAGMSVRADAVGNVIGRHGAARGRVLLLGSHLDTVRDAGRYDGPLGVLVALATIERMVRDHPPLPFAIELVAFADEEGVRFGTTYLGSSAFTGNLDPAALALTDQDGVTLADAVRAFGGSPESLTAVRHREDEEDLIGYCEVHIEQGPVLERADLPVGVVTAITGQSRATVEFVGEAGHAGTTPMDLRRDALCAAAELILHVERVGREHAGMVATVGVVRPQPGVSNVIPGSATLSIDMRHEDDALRERVCTDLRRAAAQIGERRSVELRWTPSQESASVPTDPMLSDVLARAIADAGIQVTRLPSGAGHDAAGLAAIAPVAMLFVRCAGGISHHPAESVALADVEVAIDVLHRFVALLVAIEAGS